MPKPRIRSAGNQRFFARGQGIAKTADPTAPGPWAGRRGRYALIAASLVSALCACGYRIAGRADLLPDSIRVIAIPAFQNKTTEFKIEQYLTQAVVREFISRTRYRVVSDENLADAVMVGTVTGVIVSPRIFDPRTGRATSIATLTQLSVSLRDRKSGQVLYENPSFEHRELYEISTNPDAYFEERKQALTRGSQAMARSLVSAILEGF